MTDNRLSDYLDHMLHAARQACGYVEGMRNRIAHGYFDINLAASSTLRYRFAVDGADLFQRRQAPPSIAAESFSL